MFIVKEHTLASQPCVSVKSDLRQTLPPQEHFLGVMKNQEFLLLPACEVEKLLVSDDMNVPDEETVVSALLSWVQYDLTGRQSQLPELLQHVRLPLLKPQVSVYSPPSVCLSIHQPHRRACLSVSSIHTPISSSIYPSTHPSINEPKN